MSVFKFPCIRYADADGVSIAYEVRGAGPIDLVRVTAGASSILSGYLDPIADAHYNGLATFSRLIAFDRRGTGLSDPLVSDGAPPLEQRVTDVVAVMDAVGSDRAALYSTVGDGGQVAILCAAMHPERVHALVLVNPWTRRVAPPAEAGDIGERWGNVDRPWGLEAFAPSRVHEPGFAALLASVQQVSASPAAAKSVTVTLDSDVTDVLPLVQAPTLVMHPAEAEARAASARDVAARIPNSRLVAFPGGDTYFGVDTPERTAMMEEFLTGTRPAAVSDRILATVLFTDIVASTERLAEVGDRKWREQLDRHDALVREQLAVFRGREISTAGDSFFVTFDGPARAIQCAQSIIAKALLLGLDIRAGVHTGECELRGDDLGGIAVHIGARVASLAGPGQVLTTSTVKDLVAGSGIAFADHGIHRLKGIPEPRQLYAVR
jgi:class 3 adenylate cyclase